jgi:hypothetical protein
MRRFHISYSICDVPYSMAVYLVVPDMEYGTSHMEYERNMSREYTSEFPPPR